MSSNAESGTQRSSTDSERHSSPSPTKGLNGDSHSSNDDEDLSHLDPVERLQRELERTREEKEALAAQYRNLLSKLTTMRTTLGNKLKQDAVRACFLLVVVHESSVTTSVSHRKNSTVSKSLCNN